ncbi:MAG: VWA domain-containing protein [Acidobacteriota bacterium]
MTRLASPWSLAWIACVLPLLWWWWRCSHRPAALLYGDLRLLQHAPKTWRVRLAWLPRALRVAFVVAAAIALARPQSGTRAEQVTTLGVDIVVVLDRSGSMRALDFKPNRLESAKRVIDAFIVRRPNDRIGLVPFASEAYTACPLTQDHTALREMVSSVDFAPVDAQGTAIGLGLAAAISRLERSKAKSKVVILATDGVNNTGAIAPETAAELARERGIKLYSIGVGAHGYALLPVPRPDGGFEKVTVPVEIDEQGLTRWSTMTGGRYFRADDDQSLEQIFGTIDGLEKTEISSTRFVSWADRFEAPLLIAALLLLLEVALARTVLSRVPA